MSDDSTTPGPGPTEAWVERWIADNPDGFSTMAPLTDAAREQDARLAALEADNARLETAMRHAHAMLNAYGRKRPPVLLSDVQRVLTAALAHDAAEGEPHGLD